MPVRQKSASHVFIRFVDYKPAELRIGNDWIIVYYAKNPVTGKLERFRVRVPKMGITSERKKFAKNILAEINRKLESGWSPFMEESGKSFKPLFDAIAQYQRQIEKELKEGLKRSDTIRSYNSYLKIFKEYVQQKTSLKFVIEINRAFMVNYLDYIYTVRGNSGTSYNNHLNFLGNFCNWLMDRGFLFENPAKGIQRKPKNKKVRKVFPDSVKETIKKKLPEINAGYFCLCMCTYYCFIRGTELTKIKVHDVNLDENIIQISTDQSKNKKTEIVTVPEPLKILLQNHLKNAQKSDWLFSENFLPGSTQLKPKKIRDTWSTIRTQLNLKKEYQFYSLKDTGITDLLNTGIPAVKVRNQARHHDIKITEIYLQKNNGADEDFLKTNFNF